MSFYNPSVSPVITHVVTQSILISASQFTVLSGQMTGNPDNSISINIARLRAVTNGMWPGLNRINYHFRILGDSPTISVDADGVTRKGVVLWADVVNACNLVFLSCRTDSREAAGTTVIEGQTQLNPAITGPITNAQLNSCAGIGYSLLDKRVLNINIYDGNWHDFTISRSPTGFVIQLDAVPLSLQISLSDTGLYGLRTDNVNVELTVGVE